LSHQNQRLWPRVEVRHQHLQPELGDASYPLKHRQSQQLSSLNLGGHVRVARRDEMLGQFHRTTLEEPNCGDRDTVFHGRGRDGLRAEAFRWDVGQCCCQQPQS